MGVDALVGFDDPFVEQLGQFDAAREDAGPVLVRDAQGVAKAPGDDQGGAFALAFQEGVGGDGGAHADGVDAGVPRLALAVEEFTDRSDGGVAVAGGVVGQELVGEQAPVGVPRDDIGERAASVDPELPACHARLRCSPRCSPGPHPPCVASVYAWVRAP